MINCTYSAGPRLCSQESNRVREDSGESDVVGITFTTLNRIMTQKKPDELLALYAFYAKETKRQKTQRVYSTTGFVANGLKWKEVKVRRVKKRLIEMGLIEDVKPTKRKDGKFGKPYILVRFVSTPPKKSQGGEEGGEMLTDSKGSACDTNCLKKSEETGFKKPAVEAVWKPDSRTKEEKLSTLKVPSRYPSEWEFDSFISDHELDEIINKRGDLYERLCFQKWHHWNAKHRKWVPIRNWKEYVTALNTKISEPF